MILHNKNPVIIESALNGSDITPANNVTHALPSTISHAAGSSAEETGSAASEDESGSGRRFAVVHVSEMGSGAGHSEAAPAASPAGSGSGSGDEEYEEEDTTETAKVTEPSKAGDSNRTFAQRIFTRLSGSTTEGPRSSQKPRKSTVWSSVPLISSTQASNRAEVDKPKSERRQNQQREQQKQQQQQKEKEKESHKSDGEKGAAGGIQWNDAGTRSPAARQRGDDIRNAAEQQRSIYDVPPKNQPGSASGSGGSYSGKPGGAKFWGPLPREPTEYFGGLNIPDDVEDKGPGLTVGPLITRKNKNSHYTGEGVTFSFGFGNAAESAPAPRTPRPPPSDVRFSFGEPVGASSRRGSSRFDNGPPAAGPPSSARRGDSDGSPRREPVVAAKQEPEAVRKEPLVDQSDPEAVRRAAIQAERRAAFSGRAASTDGSTSSTTTSASAASGATDAPSKKQSTTPDPNALFVIVDDPHHRTFPPVALPRATTAQSAPVANRDWFIVADEKEIPGRRAQRNEVKSPSDAQAPPAPANLILSKSLDADIISEDKFIPDQDSDLPLPSKEINWSSSKDAAANDRFYSLPKSEDGMITVSIPQGHKLTDYQWFGVYDHCLKQRTTFVQIHEIQTPEIAEIDGLKGWKYDVNSGKIRVVNCNTIMVTNFTYSGSGQTEAFFFVGSGDYPKNIVRKVRATVVGPQRDNPLTNYKGEDTLIRLPEGTKTFDINWIAVYNERENMSYGHAFIPPLVVPPCDN